MSSTTKLFTRVLNTPSLVVATIAFDGDAKSKSVHFSVAADDASAMYDKLFKESECIVVWGGKDWSTVMAALREAFLANSCTLKQTSQLAVLSIPSVGTFDIPSAVPPEDDNKALVLPREALVQGAMLQQLTQWSALYLDRAKMEKKVDAAEKEAELLRVKTEEAERELKEAQREFDELRETSEQPHDVDRDRSNEAHHITCTIRNPLAPGFCREYDPTLLRLIKSQITYNVGSEDGEDPANLDLNEVDVEEPKRVCVDPMSQQEYDDFKEKLAALDPVASPAPHRQYRAIHDALVLLDEWHYDVFAVQTAMSGGVLNEALASMPQGGCLAVTVFALFHKYGLVQKYDIDEQTFLNWASVVESGYHPNPYHNSVHAADVLHITHYVLSKGGLQETVAVSQEDIFSSLFAAAIHDYNHPGINNNFHIQARSYLATLFNDKHVLENMHVSSVFELMKMPQYDICKSMDDETKRSVKDTITELVLATDMAMHAKIVATFKRKLSDTRQLSKKDDVRLALSVTLKVADISNCCRPHDLYINWCNHITDEFYLQGDRERALGYQVSPFMDRFDPTVAKGQIAFMSYVVIPLFECFSDFLPKLSFTVDLCNKNKAFWSDAAS